MNGHENASEYAKLDAGLIMALRAYQDNPDLRDPDDGISVGLTFEGDLAAIEGLGFETHSVSGDEAMGVVRFKDIPALNEHPGVIRIAAGRPRRVNLHHAVRDIKARATVPITGPPVDGLWHKEETTNAALTQVGDATGKDVIVAVIDTGIDFTHPMFMSQLKPSKKTRIKRIWDQGQVAGAVTECPAAALLDGGGKTYGVEYKEDAINKALDGTGPAILHKDCEGHGTHVAGIAAGGVLFPKGGDAEEVGVAPEADIIVVKYLDMPDDDAPDAIRYFSAGVGQKVGAQQRFRDAVLYCLRTARDVDLGNGKPKPVVINMSFGDSAMPGDALDKDAIWIDKLMNPGGPPAGEPTHPNFPKGAVVVASVGNDGDPDDRQTARIVVPSSGEVLVPFKLVDWLGTEHTQWKRCKQRPHKPSVGVHFWYRRTPAPLAVQFAIRLPNGSVFGSDVGIGPEHEIGFRANVGQPPDDVMVAASSNVHRAGINHEDPGAVSHSAGGTVHRHHAYFFVKPKESGNTVFYHEGVYWIRIKAPATTVVYAMCEWEFFAASTAVFFRVATPDDGAPALDKTIIDVTTESSATDTLGQHVITAAAYDSTLARPSDPIRYEIAPFSSRGPLRDFSDPPRPPFAPKPDLAAPGVDIRSAQSVHSEEGLDPLHKLFPDWGNGVRFIKHDGTSMAAPMIAGVIALMLDKKPDLNTTEARTALATAAAGRPGVKPAAPSAEATNAYGSGMVDALESHKKTL